MTTIKPEGAMLIVHPLPKEESTTEAGIVAMEYAMTKAEILEVSDEWSDRYAKGDIVIFPESEGVGKSIHYQKKSCLFICGKPYMDGGDVWGRLINDKK